MQDNKSWIPWTKIGLTDQEIIDSKNIKSSCSKCGRSMTGIKHGQMKCTTSLEDGCPDKGDGGW